MLPPPDIISTASQPFLFAPQKPQDAFVGWQSKSDHAGGEKKVEMGPTGKNANGSPTAGCSSAQSVKVTCAQLTEAHGRLWVTTPSDLSVMRAPLRGSISGARQGADKQDGNTEIKGLVRMGEPAGALEVWRWLERHYSGGHSPVV